jgi:hypothetical protein
MTRAKPPSQQKLRFVCVLVAAMGTTTVAPWRLVADDQPPVKNPSKQGEAQTGDAHKQRQIRWTLIFKTTTGGDYLNQLQGLDAVLIVPGEGDKFILYSDLQTRPLKGKEGDPSRDGHYWVDDNGDNVKSLARAMGIPGNPKYIAAVFPEKLEKVLRAKEQARYKGDENNIDETLFRLEKNNGHYQPVVQSLKLKDGSDVKDPGQPPDPAKAKPLG